jgi:hypothetical protein
LDVTFLSCWPIGVSAEDTFRPYNQIANISENFMRKGRVYMASRSLNVLKKSEKGLLTGYQRSFSFWKKSFARGRCFTDGKILSSFVTDNR